ncbi:MAG: glucosylglycerol-phosphate synthase [Acidiferrobacter sp.]
MSQSLVIIYHRQPYEEHVVDGQTLLRENKSPNGITPALKGFIGNVDHATWIAWKKVSPKDRNFKRRITVEDSYGRYEVVRLPLDAKQISQFYHITSKESLWPIVHSFPDMFTTEHTDWSVFRDVNRAFAQAACEEAEPGALVWVHDYNLWLVPKFVREMRPDLRIAFYHRTPFPASDIFNILPWRDEILDSLLACDVVSFHVPRYARNFASVALSLRSVESLTEEDLNPDVNIKLRALSEPSTPTSISVAGHKTLIDSFPLGTHPALIRDLLATKGAQELTERIQCDLKEEVLIVSISRVDYTKGTQQMLDTFERLLARRPDLQGRVKLLLTTVAAAEGMSAYRGAQQKIEQLVGRINGHYGTLSWLPILLSTTPMTFEEVVCYYRAAHICWVTPLRDGLNLVAKEFVAAKAGGNGVLVLSEFAGVALELQGAILTNPYSRNSMDQAITQALDMPGAEQTMRMREMYEQVCRYDVTAWRKHMLAIFDKTARET